ncbi:hypothetical protein NDU88_000925 [Pleurodeles waltl]|uniref:Uncharacterized protein n=1 Tax=Pleurodeles waltl TaxID=8319 RepID=A0AAV7RA48_PLEWA|nr:hypothetical protein NDU88_000925 [Pleurodeles waltl]
MVRAGPRSFLQQRAIQVGTKLSLSPGGFPTASPAGGHFTKQSVRAPRSPYAVVREPNRAAPRPSAVQQSLDRQRASTAPHIVCNGLYALCPALSGLNVIRVYRFLQDYYLRSAEPLYRAAILQPSEAMPPTSINLDKFISTNRRTQHLAPTTRCSDTSYRNLEKYTTFF